MKKGLKNYIEKNHSFDFSVLIGIFCLIFVIGGFFGFIYEYIFYYFNGGMKTFYWRGGNFLPWINIYGIGSIMIYLLTYNYRKEPLKVFLMSVLSTGILEFLSGLGIYIIFDGLRYWDYNTEILNFGNIGGFICFRSVLFFGTSAMFLMYAVVPFCFYLAKKVRKEKFITISYILCFIVLSDEFYNLIFAKLLNLPKSSTIYRSLGVNYMDLIKK